MSGDEMDDSTTLESGLNRDEAYELLLRYNEDPYHIKHAETLEALMRHFATEYDPKNLEFWGQVGLLHDLDWERFPEQHTLKAEEILEEAGASPELAYAIRTHIFSHDDTAPRPVAKMEKMLFAMDELSGLINAAILVRPSKSVKDMNLKSLKKKFKQKSFAAGCSRDDIALGAELNDLTTDELLALSLEAMQSIAEADGPVD